MNRQLRSSNIIALISTIMIGIGLTPILLQQAANAFVIPGIGRAAAPISTSGDNIYIAWWTNKNGNNEVMFRASTDGGQIFGDKINLSNSSKSESVDAQIDSSGDRVFVTWWERNQTTNEPVLKISNDNGKTFGPLLKLAANGTIGSSSGG
jgi:hypothetical protein